MRAMPAPKSSENGVVTGENDYFDRYTARLRGSHMLGNPLQVMLRFGRGRERLGRASAQPSLQFFNLVSRRLFIIMAA